MKKKLILIVVLIIIVVLAIIIIRGIQNNDVKAQSATNQHQPVSSSFRENDNMALGNPSNSTADVKFADNYLMIKPEYVVSYSNSAHIPNWVSWHLSASDIGDAGRHDSFRADTALPDGFFEVIPADYAKSGFDKGHLCPSADRTLSEDHNRATFLMTNMVPQAPNNNRIVWENLESYCRDLVKDGNELYIVAGSYGQGGTGSKGFAKTIKDNVLVPAYTWKVVVVLPEGADDIHRIGSTTRIISVLLPNTQDCSMKEWTDYRVSVDSLESLTRYDFLSNVPVEVQKRIEAKKDMN
jgi:endonuclease G